ncbi:DNA repair protein RadC [Marinoscillum sp. MHG1-6]|uniref:RadC family protein n=1 Tax=Marinoscillum sp. MHG1-6 TaxID=2959627 RepID=UPI0021573419|nr:DNA repair protein RadC [Marinoscillum sp. MHG1-6]
MELTSDNFSIKHWAEEDRPREKLLLKGKASLSDAELIGILIGSGTKTLSAVDVAKIILHATENNLNKLAKLSVKDLIKFKGIGEAKAISIVSALELGRRRKSETPTAKPTIQQSRDVYEYIRPELLDLRHEEFWILLLKRNNEIIKKKRISAGGISGTFVDVRIILKSALEEMASSIILIHNHPSGNLKPSQADLSLTRKIKEAGATMDIPVLDHIIFTDNGYLSFADESLL